MTRQFSANNTSIAAGAALLCLAGSALGQQILEIDSGSLTAYLPTAATSVQNVSPTPWQRGVNIDGTARAAALQPWAFQGNAMEGGMGGQSRIGQLDLATGGLSIGEVDIALPSVGAGKWLIGRSYNHLQELSSTHRNSNGPQGFNWHQMSQPSIVVYDKPTDPIDTVYVVYGADRFLEFVRTGSSSNFYKGKNGAAGMVEYRAATPLSDEPDIYVYHDQNGVETYFFGADTGTGKDDRALGQLWKIVGPAGTGSGTSVAYVGNATTASTAVTSGYTTDGMISVAHDAVGRVYTYTYSGSAIGGIKRLEQVTVELDSVEVSKVEYSYYDGVEETGNGLAGDLRTVTVTTPLTDTGMELARTKYYRYYTGSWSNSDGSRGHQHFLKMAVGFEGCRKEPSYATESDTDLKPYSDLYAEYVNVGGDDAYRVASAFFNGQCGCSGGANGTYVFAYADNSGFSNTSGYDTAWKRRVVIDQPDAESGLPNPAFIIQYFDETGQPLSRVVANDDPSGSPDFWPTEVVRNSSGQVVTVFTPESISSYDYSTNAFTRASSAGLVNMFGRISTGDLTGFLEQSGYKKGNTPSEYALTDKRVYTSRNRTLDTGVYVARPFMTEQRRYHTAAMTGASPNEIDDTDFYDATAMTPVWWSSTAADQDYVALKKVTTEGEAADSGKNGLGQTFDTERYFRRDGSLAYSTAPFHGNLSSGSQLKEYAYRQIDATGLTTLSREDANVDSGTYDSGDAPGDFGVASTTYIGITPFNRDTEYAYDAVGRPTTTLLPNGRTTLNYYTRLADGRMMALSLPSAAGNETKTYYGPVSFSVTNHAGNAEAQGSIAVNVSGSSELPEDWIDEIASDPLLAISGGTLGTTARYSVSEYDESGIRRVESRVYHLIPSSGDGADGTNYDKTEFAYDSMGRVDKTTTPAGTINRTIFDELGRVVSRWVGTIDLTSISSNMTAVETRAYDSGGVGNGHLTAAVSDADGTFVTTGDIRTTLYKYDYRGRLIVQLPPVAPYTVNEYDNLNRGTATAQYSSASGLDAGDNPVSLATNRVALSKTFYDEAGRVWKTSRHKVDQSDGSDDDSLLVRNWYDAQGRLIKQDGDQVTKVFYDRLGRATNRFTLARALFSTAGNGTTETAYGTAVDVENDYVAEEQQTAYATDSNLVLMSVRIDRHHGDTTTSGPLDTDNNLQLVDISEIDGRPQITAMFYDGLDRLTKSVVLGTNGSGVGADYNRSGASPPSASATELVTEIVYNADGTVLDSIDPREKTTRTLYDDASRRIATIANYEGSSPTNDSDVFTRFVYEDGHMTRMWVDLNGDDDVDSDDQVTDYVYGVSPGDDLPSQIYSNDLLQSVIYPAGQSSPDPEDRTVFYAYNALGEQISTLDQTGTQIDHVYDVGGRLIDRIAAPGSGVEDSGTVKRIQLAYNARGMVSELTQYEDAGGDPGDIVNQIAQTYDDWGMMDAQIQDPRYEGVVGSGSDDYNVTYSYAKSSGDDRRDALYLSQALVYYDTTLVHAMTMRYGASSASIDAALRRVSWNDDVDGIDSPLSYTYMGLNQVVQTNLRLIGAYSTLDAVAADHSYPNLDRFNRVTESSWWKDLATDRAYYKVAIGYDENSNIKHVDEDHTSGDGTNKGWAGRDVGYAIDDMNRLTQALEGTWGGSSIGTNTRSQLWTLTQTGNWDRVKLNLNPGADSDFTDTGEYDESRTHSNANEILTRNMDNAGGAEYTPDYNKRGDLLNENDGGGASDYYQYRYDAFGRVVKVLDSAGDPIEEYLYDALGRRVGWHYDVDADKTLENTSDDPWYYFVYDSKWRIVATFRAADTSPKEVYTYHMAGQGGTGSASYIDSVAYVDRDMTNGWEGAADGTLEERYYPMQNWRADVVAVADVAGARLESIRYSSYGLPELLPDGDYNHDGTVDITDFFDLITDRTGNDPTADENWDGSVDDTDYDAFNVKFNAGLSGAYGRGHLSNFGLRKGYAGYENDGNITKLWHVRHRVLDSELGRWTRMDPIGYIDGSSKCAYSMSNPLYYIDSMGLAVIVPTGLPGSIPATPFTPNTVPVAPGPNPFSPNSPIDLTVPSYMRPTDDIDIATPTDYAWPSPHIPVPIGPPQPVRICFYDSGSWLCTNWMPVWDGWDDRIPIESPEDLDDALRAWQGLNPLCIPTEVGLYCHGEPGHANIGIDKQLNPRQKYWEDFCQQLSPGTRIRFFACDLGEGEDGEALYRDCQQYGGSHCNILPFPMGPVRVFPGIGTFVIPGSKKWWPKSPFNPLGPWNMWS